MSASIRVARKRQVALRTATDGYLCRRGEHCIAQYRLAHSAHRTVLRRVHFHPVSLLDIAIHSSILSIV